MALDSGKYIAYGTPPSPKIPIKPIDIVREDMKILKQRNLSLEYKVNKLEKLIKDLQVVSKEEVIEEKVDRAGWYFWPQ
tara:strand:- start:1381 stop:1617 length:237 start_codon:yes stop_codon:yes gene_type:complete